MYTLKELLNKAIAMKASDLHLTVGLSPTVRCNGKLIGLGEEKLTISYTEKFSKCQQKMHFAHSVLEKWNFLWYGTWKKPQFALKGAPYETFCHFQKSNQ